MLDLVALVEDGTSRQSLDWRVNAHVLEAESLLLRRQTLANLQTSHHEDGKRNV